jgi:hypothetical protein
MFPVDPLMYQPTGNIAVPLFKPQYDPALEPSVRPKTRRIITKRTPSKETALKKKRSCQKN